MAASRSRQETWFYATPEVDLERAEFGPTGPGREGLDHIAAAAERDGAQVSAHDQALRARLEGHSSPELSRLRHELASEAGAERRVEERRSDLDEGIARSENQIGRVEEERAALGDRPRWGREAKREYDQARQVLDVNEKMHRRTLERFEGELVELPATVHDARAEIAAVDVVLDRRVDMALAAARVAAPDHIVAELGERPAEGRERVAWDGAVRDVEAYRQRNGFRDRDSALGAEPKDPAARVERTHAVEPRGRCFTPRLSMVGQSGPGWPTTPPSVRRPRPDDREPEPLTLLTMHECRHTFASLLIDTGANPKAIQEVMGHSKIQTTFDVYGHLLPGSHDDVRARMDAYLSGDRSSMGIMKQLPTRGLS